LNVALSDPVNEALIVWYDFAQQWSSFLIVMRCLVDVILGGQLLWVAILF
jgi:hypothetical protein